MSRAVAGKYFSREKMRCAASPASGTFSLHLLDREVVEMPRLSPEPATSSDTSRHSLLPGLFS